MSTYTVGPGIKDAMDAAGDVPRSDETVIEFSPANNTHISLAFGRDALYYYYSEDNRTKRLPFA
jgi:hypothetical protein